MSNIIAAPALAAVMFVPLMMLEPHDIEPDTSRPM
jgi:hypothetical protein